MSLSVKCSEGVNLIGLMLDAVRRVPPGRVATYGDMARALGDVRAARAVAEVLSSSEGSDIPRHRVVDANGRIGSWQVRPGSSSTAQRLKGEGLIVRNGKVSNLDHVKFTDFGIDPVLIGLRNEQESLRSHVIESDDFGASDIIAGIDVSYVKTMASVALVRMELQSLEPIETRYAVGPVSFPYIPGYLGYRELPLVRKVYRQGDGDIILIDGQGVLHPRGFGIASQIGVCLDAVTIGAAKSRLVGVVDDVGTRAPVLVNGEVRGIRLKPKGRKEVFVSVGHRVSLKTACAICEKLMINGVPEPLRLAHILATRQRKTLEMDR